METRNIVDDRFIEAVDSYKAGNSEAFSYIYEYSEGSLRKYALYLTGNLEDAEDLVQDTYVKILEKCCTIADSTAFMAWARTIMYNLFITKCRKDAREFVCDNNSLNAFIDAERISEDPEDVAERSEIRDVVNAAVDTLTEIQQGVILEYYYNDRPVSWIAANIRISENTVKTRLFCARRALKISLKNLA